MANAHLHAFHEVSCHICNSYSRFNSQSDACFFQLAISRIVSSFSLRDLSVVYGCSDGDTRQALLSNALDLIRYILLECKSNSPFTQSVSTFQPLCVYLLRDYRMIDSCMNVSLLVRCNVACYDLVTPATEQDCISLSYSTCDSNGVSAFTWERKREWRCGDLANPGPHICFLSSSGSCASGRGFSPIYFVFFSPW